MPPARVLHFSAEDPYRSEILRAAGFTVHECKTLPELIRALRNGASVDLICISESTKPEEGSIAAANAYSPAPVVLFRSSYKSYLQPGCKLEIPPLTRPSDWLQAINELLANPAAPSS